MISQIWARFAAATLLGVVGTTYVYLENAHWRSQGKAAFLAYQSQDFDDFVSDSSILIAAGAVGLMVLIFALYELIAFAIHRLVSHSKKTEES